MSEDKMKKKKIVNKVKIVDSDVLFDAIHKACKEQGITHDNCQLGIHINEFLRLIGWDLLAYGIKIRLTGGQNGRKKLFERSDGDSTRRL